MQITTTEVANTKYAEFYLTSDEFEREDTKEKIGEYKANKYNVGVFITGKENYPEILKKIIKKQLELTGEVC